MRLIIFLLAMLAAPAWAANSGAASGLHAFTPPPGDLSVDFLHQVFGTAPDGVGLGGAGTIIAAMMAVFNLAVLSLAMLFVGYTTVVGTVNSAQDGVLLGKKMSSAWVPIRTVAGSALLLPLASGFSLIQMGVLWLAVQGVGVADAAWKAGMTAFGQTGSIGQISVPDARPLAANVLRSEVCMAIMNKTYEATGRKERIVAIKPGASAAQNSLYNSVAVQNLSQFGARAGFEYRWQSDTRPGPAACGSLAWETGQIQMVRGQAINNDNPTGSKVADAARAKIMAAHTQAVDAMVNELRPVAQQIAISNRRPTAGVIEKAALNYSNAVAIAAKAAVDASPDAAREAFIQHAETGGWILAGTWYNHLLQLQDAVQSAANVIPISHTVRIEDMEVSETLISYRDAMAFTEEYLKDRSASPRKSYEESIEDAKSFRSADDVWRILSVPFMSALDAITQHISGSNTSPLMQLRDTGNTIISAGFAIKAAAFAMAGLAGSNVSELTVGNVFNLSDALKTTTSTIEWLSAALWGLGAMLAFYLPAVPAFIWGTAVLRWLASVAEAVLAAPLMAAFIIHPDGSETVGRAGPGMMLILAMVMQPVLLVCAFGFSVLMVYVAGVLVNMMFIGMVAGATQGSLVGPISVLAYTSIYVAMMVMAMHACFSLTQAVPDNAMKFVGSVAGAVGIGQHQTDKATSGLESGAAGAGLAAARPTSNLEKKGSNSSSGAAREQNGFSNAEHMPGEAK